jgi:hypothetical protein
MQVLGQEACGIFDVILVTVGILHRSGENPRKSRAIFQEMR